MFETLPATSQAIGEGDGSLFQFFGLAGIRVQLQIIAGGIDGNFSPSLISDFGARERLFFHFYRLDAFLRGRDEIVQIRQT